MQDGFAEDDDDRGEKRGRDRTLGSLLRQVGLDWNAI